MKQDPLPSVHLHRPCIYLGFSAWLARCLKVFNILRLTIHSLPAATTAGLDLISCYQGRAERLIFSTTPAHVVRNASPLRLVRTFVLQIRMLGFGFAYRNYNKNVYHLHMQCHSAPQVLIQIHKILSLFCYREETFALSSNSCKSPV